MKTLLFTCFTGEYVIPAFWDMIRIVERLSEQVHILTSTRGETTVFKSRRVINHRLRMTISEKVTSSCLIGGMLRYLEHEFQTFYHLYRLRKDIDVILSFQSISILSLFLCRLTKRKSVLYIGGNPRETLFNVRSVFLKPLDFVSVLLWRISVHLATEVVAISPNTLRDFRIKKKIHYAYVRLLDEKFRSTKPFEERRKIVGYVGRLEDEKGVRELVDAFPLIRQKVNVDFLVVGDGSLLGQMRKAVSEKGILSNVTFTGWVSNVHDYLNEMKLLVLPSKTEGFPSVVLEAMACGTPVLATPVGDVPSIVKNDINGFVLESTSPIYISKRILELLSKPKLLSQIAENASIWVKENFSLEQTMSQWQQIFNELNKAYES